jgi:hypothetical protein
MKTVLVLVVALIGCARPERPVLYPDARVRSTTPEEQQKAIDECVRLADASLRSHDGTRVAERAASGAGAGATIGAAGGAAAGAALGHAGRGAAAGSAGGGAGGLVRGLLHGTLRTRKPTKAYRGLVDRCLRERGFHPVGWE